MIDINMTNPLDLLPTGENPPNDLYVYIEIPTGSSAKLEYNDQYHTLMLDRLLDTAMHYPTNYGFIPKTHAKDGDMMDALVLSESPLPYGIVVLTRPVGMLIMEDEKGLDEKVLTVPVSDVTTYFDFIKDIHDVPQSELQKIQHFFENYKTLNPKKWAKVQGYENLAVTKDRIRQYMI